MSDLDDVLRMLDEQGAEYTERATETGVEVLADGFLFIFDSNGSRVYL